MAEFLSETIEIKIISNVFLINLTEEIMIFQTTKPLDPSAFWVLWFVT